MAENEKNLRLIKKIFEDKNERIPDRIRLGNGFVDDFIFEDHEAADIPINALRVIFNIVSIISSEQFRPEDRPKQLSLFDEEFETENNIFASMKIRNNKISPSGSSKQVIDAYEFLAKFKMSWYKSVNSKGKEIKTFGGLISTPSYDHRGYTSFLISSYWLKKLMVIPEYNYVLYNLVYNIRNNKHIIFAIWLSKLPEKGTIVKLASLNRKFGVNYKTANDVCFKFLKPARLSLDQHNNLSFHYRYKGDSIFIIPYQTNMIRDIDLSLNNREQLEMTRRLRYFRKRYDLQEQEMVQFSYQYRNIPQTRELIEKAFSEFIRSTRLKEFKSTAYKGKAFLNEIQENLVVVYRNTKMGTLLPNGYPVII
ncbi:hypothetical protein NG800_010890 [Epilithonimonas ginsengisoli]|uniref:Replication initiation protein n=1 Tax=Epilithonimonas ginsengisoli TaxID=1245592 RepID=A0ABU4JIA9_9FLAO|nr:MULTISPECIES: hypothetical protein [Chryseobacterium group]MBV6878816.1 hypothetical protein [Epilithonimonas sp. FP105]MDW8549419.1 hypothetical protein [Epilithonimonas ginsengisoli]OAH71699.1 hypothetical protein AXA65_12065 [Chryseobacterium sp. FP211-J200]